MSFQAICASVHVGWVLNSSSTRPFQSPNSVFRTAATMVGLLVAPTAPCSSAYFSSPTAQESFQKSVAVVATISCRGLRNVVDMFTKRTYILLKARSRIKILQAETPPFLTAVKGSQPQGPAHGHT